MIILDKLMPNGALAKYHKIIKFEIQPDSTHATVNSYHTEALDLISWQDTYTIPLTIKIESIQDIELILTYGTAPFGGGSVIPDDIADLVARKSYVWAEIKNIRYNKINNGVLTTFGLFDSDETSRTNISGAVLSALMASLAATDFSEEWTLQDDTIVTLTGPEMIQVGNEVMTYISQCHSAARTLRDTINACETLEALEAVSIIEGWP